MSDTYQAVYAAAMRNIGSCNTEQVLRDAFNYAAEAMASSARSYYSELSAPSIVFRPSLSIDGNQWCALYGDNLQGGVAGFGDSPASAMADFDRAWYAKPPKDNP